MGKFKRYTDWHSKSQKGEMDFHRTNQWRRSEQFLSDSRALFLEFGLERDSLKDLSILDFGAGSRLRTLFFDGPRELVALEPLARKYVREIPWCDLDQAHELYAVPGEKKVPALVGRFEVAFSINVLDHVYDWKRTLKNNLEYLRNDGALVLSVDSHSKTDPLHPLILTEEMIRGEASRLGFWVVDSVSRSHPYHPGLGGRRLDLILMRRDLRPFFSLQTTSQ
jgi:2-polyprenyl-3-methyl-5-hydroxy-6-metoxy-1,4-benzoquinol methylase